MAFLKALIYKQSSHIMKKIIIPAACCLFAAAAAAQNIPNTAPRPIIKPAPQVKLLKKLPDVTVEMQQVVSAAYDAVQGESTVKLLIKVTNKGTATSAATQVTLKVYTHSFEGTDHILWQPVGTPVDIDALTPGQHITRSSVFTFTGLKAGTWPAKLEINVGGVMEELSLANNRSAEFSLTIR